jgi:two-component system chemotaxis sensor kinase CheA
MGELDEFRAVYFEECSELLIELEEQFAAIESGDRSADRLNAVFRAVHSIKGGGGAFGFTALVSFAHAYESLLDQIRDGRIKLSNAVVALCIRANDVLADFVRAARTGEFLAEDHGGEEKARFQMLALGGQSEDAIAEAEAEREAFEADLSKTIARMGKPAEEVPPDQFAEAPLAADLRKTWEIRFTPHGELYARANDPLLLFRELASLGELEVTAVVSGLPALADFEPFGVYCSWEITLHSADATEASIAEVFEFVEGNCDLAISVQNRAGEAFPALRIGEPAENADELVPDAGPNLGEFTEALRLITDNAPPSEPDEPVLPAAGAEGTRQEPEPVFEPEQDRRVGPAERRNEVQSIRVDLEKVDRVVNMVGELVINQSMLAEQMDDHLKAGYQELIRGLEVLAQTTRGLQDAVMAIRAQPVKSVFSRMPRLVRELAQQTGKKIKLDTAGESTEIDKTVIEQLSDPLTHMIRNSADHGIELPEARAAAGKSEVGTILLSAEQAGGSIMITVEDDGAGINRQRVLQVARERKVIGPDQQLSDEQIDNLIFAPGFSTAETVSDISGRGVGMDVVLSNIKKIGGTVQVRSAPGRGTRMMLRLPLTLAVLDIMLVKVGAGSYVIPLSSIVETMQCGRADFGVAPSGSRVLRVRGEYVQVIDLAQRFDMPTTVDLKDRFIVLCEAEGTSRVALVVDDIVGQQQVVIKSLEENFEQIDGIAGGTILGDGSVALIVDVQGLRAMHLQARAA